MKFICLGYYDERLAADLSEEGLTALMDACFEYDDELKRNGHWLGGEALEDSRTAKTVRQKDGQVSATDGPFAETKEQLGGILILEARDHAHAVEIMSKHPGTRVGPFEVRPAADLDAMVRASEERRRKRQ